MSNDIEKFEMILSSLSERTYSDSVMADLEFDFDSSQDDVLADFIKFLNSSDFSGKISLAAYKKLMAKNSIPDTALHVYKTKNVKPTIEYNNIVASLNRIKSRRVFKKSSFRDLIEMSKQKKAISFNPADELTKEKLDSYISKYCLLEIFSAWKEQKWISSSIVDDLNYKSFYRRCSTTMKATLKKFIESYLEKYRLVDKELKIKSINNHTFYFSHASWPVISVDISAEYDSVNMHGSYNDALDVVILPAVYSKYSNARATIFKSKFNLFDSAALRYNQYFDTHFNTNIVVFDRYMSRNNQPDSNMSRMNVGLENSRFITLFIGNQHHSENLYVNHIDYYKSAFNDIEVHFNTIFDDISLQLRLMKKYYVENNYQVSLVEYFKMLEDLFNNVNNNVCYLSGTNITTFNSVNSIIFSYLRSINLILKLEPEASSFTVPINNPFMLFITFINNVSFIMGDKETPLNVPLYSNLEDREKRIAKLLNVFKLINNRQEQEFASAQVDFYLNKTNSSLCSMYNNFIRVLHPDLTVGFDVTDKLLFFRHLNEFIQNPVSLLDGSFDMTNFSILDEALERVDSSVPEEVESV